MPVSGHLSVIFIQNFMFPANDRQIRSRPKMNMLHIIVVPLTNLKNFTPKFSQQESPCFRNFYHLYRLRRRCSLTNSLTKYLILWLIHLCYILADTEAEINRKELARSAIRQFLDTLEKQKSLVTEFDAAQFQSLVDFIAVYSKENIQVTFRNGMEIKA